MASRKGIAITAAIIGGFVAASFLVYFIPEQTTQSDIITFGDAKERLEFAMDRNQVIIDEFQIAFQAWQDGDIGKDAFDLSSNVAIEQIDLLMLELRGRSVPNEWNQSYILYIQALENYKAYITKTKGYVEGKSGGIINPQEERDYTDAMSDAFERAEGLAQEARNAIP